MGQSDGPSGRRARLIALVGPFQSGKTTLLEAILARTDAVQRQGKVAEGNTIGDQSAEARAHQMSVELNVAETKFLDDTYTFIDCPGSIEFQHESAAALTACDVAIVVTEPDAKKAPHLQIILRDLEQRGIPHILFINKIDKAEGHIRDLLPLLQPASRKPLVLRQIPIWKNGIATGFVDLALERAFVYREHAPSEVVEMPKDLLDREHEARFNMLEKLADYDDELMEQLLSDIEPPRDRVFDDLAKELKRGDICPVFLGSAENGNGILRLMKALRHEAPTAEETAARLGVGSGKTVAQVLKSMHTAHGGKVSVVRLLSGEIADGAHVHGANAEDRVAGVFTLKGQELTKRGAAKAGETVGLGRLDSIATGETITTDKTPAKAIGAVAPPQPVYSVAVAIKEKKDEVKLTAAIHKIVEEDPSIALEHSHDTHQIVLHGQGEMHLRVAIERLVRKYGVDVERRPRLVAYKETIRKSIEIRGRHKKQSGGHGQFGDVVLQIAPLPRGSGFQFEERITGGVVPRNFFPSVEKGVKDYLHHGPLGFTVVDVAVALTDGSYHAVDSSDMAFQTAGRIAMSEGMPQCSPVLLEPIMHVEIAVPNDATSKVNSIISSRRGHILGFDGRPGFEGWDLVQAQIPESEMSNLIVELRSVTAGVGTYTQRFDHLSELTGKVAEQVLAEHSKQAA
ncbi:MAG: elongation factor G [Hyphomicrobiaceae bacterium]